MATPEDTAKMSDRELDEMGMAMDASRPTVEIVKDYDGYFERLVRGMIERKQGEFKHSRIVVTSGPWRPYAVTTRKEGDTIHLDFYAALRAGFGSLSDGELAKLTELL